MPPELTEELKALNAELIEAFNGMKAETRTRLDELDVRMQKANLRGDGGDLGGRLSVGTGSRSRFVGLEQKIEPHFADETKSDINADNVRVGAVIAGLLGGEPVRKQLEADELKTLIEGTGPGGGYNVPAIIGSRFIDAVRPLTRVAQAGASSYAMPAPMVSFPGWSTLIDAGWRSETGAFHQANAKFRQVTLTAKMVSTEVELSIELLQDAGSDVGAISQRVEQEMSRALGQAVDKAALFGAGTENEPLGLYNLDDATDVNTSALGSGNGGTPTDYDWLLDAMLQNEEANFTPTAVIWSPRTNNTLRQLVTGLVSDKTKLRMPDDVAALRRLATNQVPNDLTVGSSSDCSAAFIGDWSYAVVGYRPDLGISTIVDPYTGASSGIVKFLAWLRADVAALQPQAFTVVSGIRA